jgi:hypothetical protein
VPSFQARLWGRRCLTRVVRPRKECARATRQLTCRIIAEAPWPSMDPERTTNTRRQERERSPSRTRRAIADDRLSDSGFWGQGSSGGESIHCGASDAGRTIGSRQPRYALSFRVGRPVRGA